MCDLIRNINSAIVTVKINVSDEMWIYLSFSSIAYNCWRRMEKISWTDRVNNEAVLHWVKKERNILHTLRRREASWIGHILRRSCLQNTSLKERLLWQEGEDGDVRRCCMTWWKRRYWKLKEEAQDRTLWRTQFGRGYGTFARQNTNWTWTNIRSQEAFHKLVS
jgi:hypothetical protein